MEHKYMTVEEVARLLRVSRRTVYLLIRSKKLHTVKVGNRFRITNEDIEEYLNKNKEKNEIEEEENA